jgi:hypothetical protein
MAKRLARTFPSQRQAHEALRLVRTISRMKQDSEEDPETGEEYVMENDDAVATLNRLIDEAREIVDETPER